MIDGVPVPLQHVIEHSLTPKLRCEAECDLSFKQVIPYVLVEHRPTGRFFMTTRLGGDERLAGQANIGMGGHIEEDEGVMEALYRELEEEIGLAKDEIADITFCGFIQSNLNEVDSAHLGMIYRAFTDREDISCREADKLTGGWFTVDEIGEARRNGYLESWSVICFDRILRKEDEEG